ncbi:MAG: phospholipase D-like domain-containing protein [Pseudomonadota bacterium]
MGIISADAPALDFAQLPEWVWGLVVLLLGGFSAAHALLHKRDSRSAVGWIALCLFVPVVGPFLYALLGVNRYVLRAGRLKSQNHRINEGQFEVLGDDPVGRIPAPREGIGVTAYLDGPSAFEAMLECIEQASTDLWLSQYIFEKRGIGVTFIGALGRAAARGVRVCVLLDGVGTWYSWGSTRRALERVGVQVAIFSPPRLLPVSFSANLRNHRKLLIVDMEYAFAGGMNIRSSYVPSSPTESPKIQDCHFCLRGTAVRSLAGVFRDDWYMTTGQWLESDQEPTIHDSTARSRVTVDGPDNAVDLITLVLQTAIGSAQRSITIMTPYFLPPRELLSALQAASLRGVDVTVILPARNNLPIVHWASRHLLRQLLPHGVRALYQQGHFDHSKLLRVDDEYSIVGSANLDPRSLRLNYELIVEIWCPQLSQRLDQYIAPRRQGATELTAQSLREARLWSRFRDAFFSLFIPFL